MHISWLIMILLVLEIIRLLVRRVGKIMMGLSQLKNCDMQSRETM